MRPVFYGPFLDRLSVVPRATSRSTPQFGKLLLLRNQTDPQSNSRAFDSQYWPSGSYHFSTFPSLFSPATPKILHALSVPLQILCLKLHPRSERLVPTHQVSSFALPLLPHEIVAFI